MAAYLKYAQKVGERFAAMVKQEGFTPRQAARILAFMRRTAGLMPRTQRTVKDRALAEIARHVPDVTCRIVKMEGTDRYGKPTTWDQQVFEGAFQSEGEPTAETDAAAEMTDFYKD